MRFNITWRQVRIAAEAYVLIKYNVITDAIRFARHTMNAAGNALNGFAEGVSEIGNQVERTGNAIAFQSETVGANLASVNGSVLKLVLTTALVIFLLYRFGPLLFAVLRGPFPESGQEEPVHRKKTTTKSKAPGGKEARFQKWVARYGGDFRTKKEAKAAFDKFEKDMGY